MRRIFVAVIIVVLTGISGRSEAQISYVEIIVNQCTGTCTSFNAFDVGSFLTGYVEMSVSPGTWDDTNISDFSLSLENSAAPLETYIGTNPTTANPFPITPATVQIRASSLSGAVTGGSVDAFGDVTGTILLELTVAPFSTNGVWMLLNIEAGNVGDVQLCYLYETAGCIPTATEVLSGDGFFEYFHYVLTASPESIDFGEVAIGDSEVQLFTVTNTGDFTVNTLTASIVNSSFVLVTETCSMRTLAPNDTCELLVAFTPSFPALSLATAYIGTEDFFSDLSISLRGTGVPPVDTDGDGVFDHEDNCQLVANDQSDPDNDGIGTPCDADFNNDCIVNFLDLSEFANAFSGSDPEFDLNGDTSINFLDLAEFANLFSMPPGPSEVSRICQ